MKKSKRKVTKPDSLHVEPKALPDLEGIDIDLPGLDFDFSELDDILGIGDDLPGLNLGIDSDEGVLSPHKNVRARVVGNATKSKPLCGAKTRTGTPCKAPGIGRGGRCKLHGGKSTGPKTQQGKARSLAALRRGL